jgi:ABC-type transporter Mla subunit MlaD
MAEKKTTEKVKELLEGHCYGPLREAAEKWLEAADEKYDVKEKAGKAWDKLNDAADAFADASGKFNETMSTVGDKVTEGADKLAEKAAPALDELKVKTAPVIDDLKGKAAESELISQLKEGICTLTEVIDTFSKKEMKDRVGEEAAEQIRQHAEALKAEGKKFCDCPACTKAREILRDLGVDLETEAEKEAE